MKYFNSLIVSIMLLGFWGCSDLGDPISCTEGLGCDGVCGSGAVEDCAGTCNGDAILDGDNCTNISYSATIQPILTANCISCHDASHSTGLNLTSLSNLLEGSNLYPVIIDGIHAESILWLYINTGFMPMGGEKLSDSQIEFIATWIDERD